MIEELKVSGFRSLKDVTWRPGRLNVVIGPNGSGKSNLLRALEFISRSASGRLDEFVQSEGGFSSILWDGAVDSIHIFLITHQSGIFEYELFFSKAVRGDTYYVNGEELGYEFTKGKLRNAVVKLIQRDRRFSAAYTIEGSLETEKFSEYETTLSLITNLMNVTAATEEFKDSLLGINVFNYIDTSKVSIIRLPSIARFEKALLPEAKNLISVLHTLYTGNRDFKNSINSAMLAAFGEDFEELVFPPASDQRIQMRIRWKTLKREQSTADLSDGTLRFLFLIAVLANPNPPSLIAIDEPETGLHPSMLPIIAEYAVNAALKTQVIFTTHSDQFLDAFRETAEQPTVTVANWANGETTLKTLDGEALKVWLDNFSLGALYRTGELESDLIS